MGSLMHRHDKHNASLLPFQLTQIWNAISRDQSGHYGVLPPQGWSLLERKLSELTTGCWCKQLHLSLSFKIYLWIRFSNEKSQQESAISFFMWIIQEYSWVFKKVLPPNKELLHTLPLLLFFDLSAKSIWQTILGKSLHDSRHLGGSLPWLIQEKVWTFTQTVTRALDGTVFSLFQCIGLKTCHYNETFHNS